METMSQGSLVVLVSIPYRYYKNLPMNVSTPILAYFQFLIGTIKTGRGNIYISAGGLVSIPYRYYKNCTYI